MEDSNLCLLKKGNKKEMPLIYKPFGTPKQELDPKAFQSQFDTQQGKGKQIHKRVKKHICMGGQNKCKLHFKPHCLWVASKFPHI